MLYCSFLKRMSFWEKDPVTFRFVLVCFPAGRPGSHVLVPRLHVLVRLESPRCRPPFHYHIFSFKPCGVLPAKVFRLCSSSRPCALSGFLCIVFVYFSISG